MVRAFRYAALACGFVGLAATAAAQEYQNLVLTGVDLKTTSGTLTVQRVTADEATMSPDGMRVITRELRLQSHLEKGGEIDAKAPTGEIVVGGDKIVWRPDIPKPDFGSIRYYGHSFSESGARGDVLLKGGEEQGAEQVIARIADRAIIYAPSLIWSKRHNRFLVPYPFEQIGEIEGGEEFRITAGALSADEFFNEWIYYTDTDAPIVIEYTRPLEDDSE